MQKKDSDYKLILDEEVIKFLEKLSRNLRRRIFSKIQKTKSNPLRYFVRLEGRSDYKLRVGDYRVITIIKDKTIFVEKIGHRKKVYK